MTTKITNEVGLGVTEALKLPIDWRQKYFAWFGIRSFLFLSLFLIAALPIAVLSIWVERSAIEKEISAVSEKHLLVAKNLSAALSRYVTDIKLFVDLVAMDAPISGAGENLRTSLQNLNISYILTIGPGIKILSSVNAHPEKSIELPNPELLKELRAASAAAGGKTTISGIKSYKGSPHFFVLKTLSDDRLVLAPLEPTYLNKIQKSIAFGDRGHSMIVDHLGRVVAHPNAGWQASSKDASKLSVVKKMITQNTGVTQFYSPPMKADMIAGYTFVPETGWGVMVPQPMSELIDRAHDIQSVALLIATLEILLALVISWWLSKLLANPVLDVARAARRVSKGDLTAEVARMPSYVPSEMRTLGHTFNEMVADLKFKTDELSEALIKAQEGSRAKSQFMAMMSHEIRTPMTGVLGILEILGDTKMDEEQQKYVSIAHNSGLGLIQILNDILDFSKIESGKLDISICPFDIRDSIQEVVKLFQPTVDKKGIGMNIQISNSVPDIVTADPQRTRQILFNLIGNAIKFTETGAVTVDVDFTGGIAESNGLVISVKDTGIGIPSDMHDKLFENYEQCDASYSRKYGGTGLGLAISKRLVTIMGGTISFESVYGDGSTFWFTLPTQLELQND